MKIPKELDLRESFYDDLVMKCTASRETRQEQYGMLRYYYLFGRGPDEPDTPYNKIYSHIDTLTSFLFASETTKFSIHLAEGTPEEEYFRVKPLNRAVNDCWLDSNSDQVFSQALTWSLVFNSMFCKLRVTATKGKPVEITPFAVDPASFGVLREDLPFTDRQEAMVHSYYTTRSQLDIDLKDHPQKDVILENLTATTVSMEQADGLSRILLTATTPAITGNVNENLNLIMDYIPKVDEELVGMNELWVWDDDFHDYRVVTRTTNGMTIYDRKNFFLDGEHPFVQICPSPLYSYYYGASEVAGMTGLQKWRNERTQQIKKLLDRQVNPPTAMTGWMGLLEEKQYAAFNEGSYLSTDSMQAKIDRFAPEMPTDIFMEVREIDAMFAERSGLQNILMGKGETGVRSGRQTSELARLSSARIKKRALIVEDALEKMATMYLKIMQKYDPTEYRDEKSQPFVAEQFTKNYVVKVDAHSNSPLFIEDQKQLAVEMLEAHAIGRERFVQMLDPPDKELILRELKVIEAKEDAARKQEQAMEQQKESK